MSTKKPAFVTFDCYGTLVDWEGGVASFLYDLALRQGDSSPPLAQVMRTEWEAVQFEIIQGEYRPYKQVLKESLRQLVANLGYTWDEADAHAFVRSMCSWQPFPDTVPALKVARAAGAKLVILSNTDRDIIQHTLRHMDVPFDLVITAEDCGAYKPASKVFEQALTQLAVPAQELLHVAFGFRYDNDPAKNCGWQTAWLNRTSASQPSGAKPDYQWRDLWSLAELFTS